MLDHKDFMIGLEDLKALRAEKDSIENKEKEVNEKIESLVRDLVEYMESTDQLSVKVRGFGTAMLTSKKFYSIDKDDPYAADAFETYLRDKGDWDLVTAVHASKLHGYYKEKLDLNEELPPGIKTTIKNNITIRGIK
jgi:hypothetical protein